ncbi:hypothetical protein BUALT_Bualt02G0244900 [Buddleja alternifolia]|uniref:Agenet domain-containing protein n=1 Tax=Buddleja alternifolia TaxID=168488 RepID=A0AAV6YDS1_9LAMI|nr:hypothetical protein BUALT_Bualt02G0244900 [Buddleja alternifolia]
MVTSKSGESSSENPFKRGAQVEVSLEDEGFRGSWYTATVVRSLSNNKTSKKPPRRLFLQFHTLTALDQPLREAVDLILVRPIPPRESRRRFHVSEDVDAFHNDGWWEGIVTAVLDGGNRYSVFFRSSREQIDFAESQLRVHREWVYGKWVPPLEDDPKDDDLALQPSQESRVSGRCSPQASTDL